MISATDTVTSQPKFNTFNPYYEIAYLVENCSPAWVLIVILFLGVCFAVLVYLCQLLGAKICQMLSQGNAESQIIDYSNRRHRSYSACHICSRNTYVLPLHQQPEPVEPTTKTKFLDEILLKRDGVLPPPQYHEEERNKLEKDVCLLCIVISRATLTHCSFNILTDLYVISSF
jgi:hypothetical protein